MGAVCSCLQVEDIYPNSDIYRHCICISCFIQQFLNVYSALFQRGEMHAVPSSIQGATPLASAGITTPSADNSLLDTYRAPIRPLPYDADPRCSRLQRDGRLSRHEKASSHFDEESEPLRSSSYSGSLGVADKWNGSSMKHQSAKVTSGEAYIISSSEDEDVCPTCLEEYTPENPKIMTQCSHHFHLGCIYEWMERSESCPICGKVISLSRKCTTYRPSISKCQQEVPHMCQSVHVRSGSFMRQTTDPTVNVPLPRSRSLHSSGGPHVKSVQKKWAVEKC